MSRARRSLDDQEVKKLYLGKKRHEWVAAAYRSILSSTTPSGRWMMCRQGFLKFEHWARPAFDQLAGFTFMSGELRWIFDRIGRYSTRNEKKYHAKFEELYEKQKYHEPHRASDEPDREDIDDITTSKVVDGFLKERVH